MSFEDELRESVSQVDKDKHQRRLWEESSAKREESRRIRELEELKKRQKEYERRLLARPEVLANFGIYDLLSKTRAVLNEDTVTSGGWGDIHNVNASYSYKTYTGTVELSPGDGEGGGISEEIYEQRRASAVGYYMTRAISEIEHVDNSTERTHPLKELMYIGFIDDNLFVGRVSQYYEDSKKRFGRHTTTEPSDDSLLSSIVDDSFVYNITSHRGHGRSFSTLVTDGSDVKKWLVKQASMLRRIERFKLKLDAHYNLYNF